MSGRQQSQLFIALLYLLVITTLLGTSWLFLCNLDQVASRKIESNAELDKWRTEKKKSWSSFWPSIKITIVTATITMMIAALFGIPAAYALSRYKFRGSFLIDILFSSIIVLPSSSVGLCLIILFQHTALYDMQKWLSISVVYSLPGIVIAQLVLSLAMGMSAWKASFDNINPRLEQVARTLGSSPWRVFRTVTLPCAKGGLIAGLVLAWTRAAAEFGSVLIFCSTFSERPKSYFSDLTCSLGLEQADTLAVSMWSQIEYGNVEEGFAIGFTLALIGLISIYTINRLGGKTYVW